MSGSRATEVADPAAPDRGEGSRGGPPPMPWAQLLLVCATPASVQLATVNCAPLLPLFMAEFGISNTWAGALVSATVLTHTALQLLGGHVSGSIGVKRAVVLALSLTGVSIAASAVAPDFQMLLLSRLVLGVGTAIGFIGGLAFVNGLVPPERRVVAQGFYGAGANAGVLMAMLLSERSASLLGWRGNFILQGAAILGIAWFSASRLPAIVGRSRAGQPSWRRVLRRQSLYLLGLAHVLTYGVFLALSTWTATFLWQTHGVGLEWAGPLAALLAASAMLARTVGGSLSVGRERQAIIVSCLGAALGTGLLPLLPSLATVLLALLAVGLFSSVPFGAIFSYVSLLTGEDASPRSLSLINFVANLGALGFPILVGYALDVAGSFTAGFGLVSALCLLGTAVLALHLPRTRRTDS